MLRRPLRASVLCLCGLGLTVACTINTTDNGDGGTATGGTNRDASTTTPADSGTGDSGVKNCSSQTDEFACLECCGDLSSATVAAEKAYDECACAGECATECAAFCGDMTTKPSETCALCLTGDSATRACTPAYDNVCTKDPACNAVTECIQVSSCNAKPLPDGGF